jgi:hypothetical protein
MNAHFRRGALIAFLALVTSLSGGAEVYAEPTATAALSPPSDPLGDRAITNSSLAQRVVLYEEEPGNPPGRRTDGSVVWSTETALSDTTGAPELALRADIGIPDRKLEMTWRLRRTPGLSTSHSMEFLFKLPPDFGAGGIINVPGFWMKPTMQTRGAALAGLAVKVKHGYFLIGLSNTPADRERNIQLLKDRPWIDIPIEYTDNRRAILAMEKGTPGEQAFQQAFAAWNE